MRFDNLLLRGLTEVKGKKFMWYSWPRFKGFAEKENTLEKVLASKERFLTCLQLVHDYYCQNSSRRENAGLTEFKGP